MSTTGLSTHNTNTGDTGRTTGFGNTFTGTGTGSWADSTHSVIWMSRDGKSQALPYLRRTRASQYASLLVAALLTLAAASNLIDVYGSAASWALAALPSTIIGSLVALAGTVPALRLWWQMLFMAVAQLVVGPVLFLNDTTIAHIVPTLRTLTQGWMNMLGSFKFILSVEPPTGTADGCLLAVWTICLWFALLTGIFAVTEDGRFTMIAIIPVTANLAICALLGSSSGYYRMFVGTIMALIQVYQGEREFARDNKPLGTFELTGIAPAPRGVPQIEVTFDIDANGIVHVSAKDKGTGKEQSMTITGGSGLGKDEIDRMVKEAEAHEAEDKKRKEDAETRNQAESFAYQTEKLVNDNKDKLSDDVAKEVTDKVNELKEALKGEDIEKIKSAQSELMTSAQKIGQALYAQQGAADAAGAAGAAGSAPADDDVVDAEVVDDDDKDNK